MDLEAIMLSLLEERLRLRRISYHERGSHQWHMNRAMIRAGVARIRQARAGQKPTATVKDFVSWPVPWPNLTRRPDAEGPKPPTMPI